MVQNSSKEEQEEEREEEKEEEKKPSITNFNTPTTRTAMKTVMGRQRQRDQRTKIENTEVEFHPYAQLSFPQGSNQMELSEGTVSFLGLCFWAIAIYWQGRMEKGREEEKRREEKRKGWGRARKKT